MIKISKKQLTVIERSVEDAYARDMARYMREEHAEDVDGLPDGELLARVTIGIARAQSYGLTFDEEITAFVAMMFAVGPTFDDQPAIRAVLTDDRLPPNWRIDALWDRTTDDDWEEAARLAEHAESAWQSARARVEGRR